MKHIFIPLVLFLASCNDPATNEFQSRQIDSLKDRLYTLESAQAGSNSRLDAIEREQTFQFKDIDSTKRAVVWLGSQVIRHDTVISSGKSGLIKSEKRARTWGLFIRTLIGR
jgi:hypothetical protein